MLSNPNVRKWAYVAQVVIGAVLLVLVTAGVISQEAGDSLVTAVGGVLGVVLLGNGELARRNVSTAPTITKSGAQVIADALAQHAQGAVAAGAAEVDRARAELERRLGR